MELVETRTQSENASEIATIKDAIKKLIEGNPNGGEITLNDFCKKLPNASRTEVVRLLKKSGQGVFITGRRGRLSRFVHGPPALPFLTRAVQTAPSKVHPKPEVVSPTSGSSSTTRFELRIGVGGQVTTIPIDIDLALAAA